MFIIPLKKIEQTIIQSKLNLKIVNDNSNNNYNSYDIETETKGTQKDPSPSPQVGGKQCSKQSIPQTSRYSKLQKDQDKNQRLRYVAKKLTLLTTVGVGSTLVATIFVAIFSMPSVLYVYHYLNIYIGLWVLYIIYLFDWIVCIVHNIVLIYSYGIDGMINVTVTLFLFQWNKKYFDKFCCCIN